MRKLLALLLSFALILTFYVLAEEEEETKFYGTALTTLTALGINPFEEDQDFDVQLTRAQFIALAANYAATDKTVISGIPDEALFADVFPNDWHSKILLYAAKMGYIKGVRGGYAEPDRYITYAEALQVLDNILGYQLQTMSGGGFPAGAVSVANQIKLTKGVFAAANVTAGTAAQLFCNMLDISVQEQTAFGSLVELEKGITFSQKVYKLYHKKGILQSTGFRSVSTVTVTREDKLCVSGVYYNLGKQDIESMLGAYIEYYYYYDTDSVDGDFIYAAVDASRNKILKFDAVQLIGYSDRTITYYEKYEKLDRELKAKISQNADIAYNGGLVSRAYFSDDIYNGVVEGEFELIDNDGDETYDIVKITSISNYVVHKVDLDDNYILGKNIDPVTGTATATIDITHFPFQHRLRDANGKGLKLSNIQEWDVVSVMASLDGEFVDAVMKRETLTGTVSETGRDEKGDYVKIEGVTYYISPLYNAGIASYHWAPVTIRLTSKFYFDYKGKIAALDNSVNAGAMALGYMAFVLPEKNSLDSPLVIRIFTNDARLADYTLSDKCIINGRSVKGGVISDYHSARNDETYKNPVTLSLWGDINNNGHGFQYIHQLVRYRLGTTGEVVELNTANADMFLTNNDDDPYALRRGNESAYLTKRSANKPYRNVMAVRPSGMNENNGGSGGAVEGLQAADATRVFLAPYDTFGAEAKDFIVTSYYRGNFYWNNAAIAYGRRDSWFDFYYMAWGGLTADAIVVHSSTDAKIQPGAAPAIVEKIAQGLDDDGNTVVRIYAVGNGVPKTLFLTGKFDINKVPAPPVNASLGTPAETFKLEKGDIIRCAWNRFYEIEDIQVVYKKELGRLVPTEVVVQSNTSLSEPVLQTDAGYYGNALGSNMIPTLPNDDGVMQYKNAYWMAYTGKAVRAYAESVTVADPEDTYVLNDAIGKYLKKDLVHGGTAATCIFGSRYARNRNNFKLYIYDTKAYEFPIKEATWLDIRGEYAYGADCDTLVMFTSGDVTAIEPMGTIVIYR